MLVIARLAGIVCAAAPLTLQPAIAAWLGMGLDELAGGLETRCSACLKQLETNGGGR
jgi:hypothetical protein